MLLKKGGSMLLKNQEFRGVNAPEKSQQIRRCCSVSHKTVQEYVFRATRAALSWPLPADMYDGALERLLFPAPVKVSNMPSIEYLRKELVMKHVTLMLLWQGTRRATLKDISTAISARYTGGGPVVSST